MNYALKQSKSEDIVVGLICLVFEEYNYRDTTSWDGYKESNTH